MLNHSTIQQFNHSTIQSLYLPLNQAVCRPGKTGRRIFRPCCTLTFDQFNLHDDLLAGIDAMNYRQATPIQEQAIPKILNGHDLIACAQTGTGKTAAYLVPLLDKISQSHHDHTSVLVLVPTRELAKQIDEQVEGFGYFVKANSIAIYGGGKGDDWDKQRKALINGADIIVATPGRLIALLQLGQVDFSKLDVLVLDEADKMLDMGFSDDIMTIVRDLPTKRQTLMFSATMPNKIREFAKKLLHEPHEIRLAVSKPAEKIDQQFYMAFDHQKLPVLAHLIKEQDVQSMVLFTSRKSSVNTIVRELAKVGLEAKGVSSDIEQDEREAVLRGFKNKQFPILVATDVLSRGIDIDSLSHVVNFDSPRDAEDYVHRIGRTARADTTGTAITFVSDEDQDRIVKIERLLEREFEKRAITEALDLGPAPEFDPRRFSGLRHKRGTGGGRHDAGRGQGDRNRYATGDSTRQRNPRAERAAKPTTKLVNDEAVLDETLVDGQTTTDPTQPRLLPDGTPAPKRNKRNKKRKPVQLSVTSDQLSGDGEQVSVDGDEVLGAEDLVSDGEEMVVIVGSVAAVGGEQPAGMSAPKRKKRNKKRKPRPVDPTLSEPEDEATGGIDIDPEDDLGPVGSLNQRFLEGEL